MTMFPWRAKSSGSSSSTLSAKPAGAKSLTVGRRTVDLKRITCPVLNLMAEHDDLVPPAQSQPFNDLVGSQDRETIKVAPAILDWRWVRRAGTLAPRRPVAGGMINERVYK